MLVSTGKEEVMGDCLSMMAHFLINGTLDATVGSEPEVSEPEVANVCSEPGI